MPLLLVDSGSGAGLVDLGFVRGHDEKGQLRGVKPVRDADVELDSGAQWLGAVAVPRTMAPRQINQLLIALRLLMNAYPPLRVLLNMPMALDDKFFLDM